MNSQSGLESSSAEYRVFLALQALKQDASLNVQRAAKLYNISRSTLHRRRAGKTRRRNCTPNSMKLTSSEESAIVQHVLDLSVRGFSPAKDMARDMANKLLAARHRDPVGKNWGDNFIRRTPELKTRQNRPYDRQQASNKDPWAVRA